MPIRLQPGLAMGDFHATGARAGLQPGPHVGEAETLDEAVEEGVVEPADQRGLAGGQGVERAVAQQHPSGFGLGLEAESGEHRDNVTAGAAYPRAQFASPPLGMVVRGPVGVGGVVDDGVGEDLGDES
jgi:hypothetical protein